MKFNNQVKGRDACLLLLWSLIELLSDLMRLVETYLHSCRDRANVLN